LARVFEALMLRVPAPSFLILLKTQVAHVWSTWNFSKR